MSKLYLDDIRKAPDESWTVVRSFEEFQRYFDEHGIPEVVSFDHDLGHGQAYTKPRGKRVWIPREDFANIPTGYDACKWMLENFGLPNDVRIHSMNPVGAQRIRNLLDDAKAADAMGDTIQKSTDLTPAAGSIGENDGIEDARK